MTISTLVDTNIFIDVLLPGHFQAVWSARHLEACFDAGDIAINPIIWSELASPIRDEASLEGALAWLKPRREQIPWEAAFRAGLAQAQYRRAGGTRERTLPDFLIGAHAQAAGHRLLTRDATRYRSYFPDLEIIAPDTHP
ncbi:type II toxin-antitoxin system VapC family toxin [Aminobacter sp. AP02]|uniref:type II toxin-antitoxin system VapC family toxin n=1 Tax=Aminobacter sp. AP02 TaxID=2135737 RepID=UPI000D6B37FF|nr:type II toxin-antitoxin system VapC family toxin [Aminobacter sp. AP02]PWK63557.1 hypothetical protein C8K44_12451 [Aminobacter sp. AP02]